MPTFSHKDFMDLAYFMSQGQAATILDALDGEEKEWFAEAISVLAQRIAAMPRPYETDGQGRQAIAYLHYFKNGCDWYITERDGDGEQLQAFGLADLGMGFPELGYIPIAELIALGVELDLHWEPKPLERINPDE